MIQVNKKQTFALFIIEMLSLCHFAIQSKTLNKGILFLKIGNLILVNKGTFLNDYLQTLILNTVREFSKV